MFRIPFLILNSLKVFVILSKLRPDHEGRQIYYSIITFHCNNGL